MESDFIYERIKLAPRLKMELVTGGERYSGKVWREIARQIYCENGKDDFRELGHYPSGAPFIYGEDSRISISHTDGCFAVATLAVRADSNLAEFSPETALGIDVERADREKVMKLRSRFLSEEEEAVVPDTLEANVIAWTCKEALLKASMDATIDWRHKLRILRLPRFDAPGLGRIILGDTYHDLSLVTRLSSPFIITVGWKS